MRGTFLIASCNTTGLFKMPDEPLYPVALPVQRGRETVSLIRGTLVAAAGDH